MIHIEGMGWFGCLTAVHLLRRGELFTWNDIDDEHRAWPASTGLVYPAGDERSVSDLRVWQEWAIEGGPEPGGPGPVYRACEPVQYVYTQKTPPHSGPRPAAVGSGWSVSSCTAVQVNVPRFVGEVRQEVALMRAARPTGPHVLIRAHGFTERLHRWVWGWNRPVHLSLAPELTAKLYLQHPAIYCREGRYVMAYAYPIPGQPGTWWAGSSLIPQKRPHQLDVVKHSATWLERFTRLAPFATVDSWGDPVQGWRPQGRPDDTGYPTRENDVITFPPLWHSGVRWGPSTVHRALELL